MAASAKERCPNDDEEDADENRFRGITIPLSFDAMVPISAKLLKKQKDIKEMDDELACKREEFETRKKKAEQRRGDLDKQEHLLVQSLKDFEGFIKERERKRYQSEAKYEEEHKLVMELNVELERLQEELTELTTKNDSLVRYVAKYKPAFDFLNTVAEESVMFGDVYDIISFYDTLVVVNKELTQVEKTNLEAVLDESEKLLAFETEKQNEVLALSNRLYWLCLFREDTLDQVLAMEARFNDVQWSGNKKTMTFAQIAMAITSMYMTICEFEKISSRERNPMKQMEKVQDFIQEWSESVPEAKRMYEQEAKLHHSKIAL